MATLTGPLFSMQAHGTIGNALTYRMNNRLATVGQKNIPANPKSDAQNHRRAMTKWLTQIWRKLTPTQKYYFSLHPGPVHYSQYHTWLKINSDRWSANLAPACRFPIALDNTPTVIDREYFIIKGLRQFYVKFMPAVTLGFSLIVQYSTSYPVSWDSNKVILVAGPAVDLPGPYAMILGEWQAPTDDTLYFSGKLGSDTGGLSPAFDFTLV